MGGRGGGRGGWGRRGWAANRPAGPAPTIATLTGGFCVGVTKLSSLALTSLDSTISYRRIELAGSAAARGAAWPGTRPWKEMPRGKKWRSVRLPRDRHVSRTGRTVRNSDLGQPRRGRDQARDAGPR